MFLTFSFIFSKVLGSACTLLSANNNPKLVSYTRYGISLGTVTIILTRVFLVFSFNHPIGFWISTRIILVILLVMTAFIFSITIIVSASVHVFTGVMPGTYLSFLH